MMAGFENLPCFFLDYKGDNEKDDDEDEMSDDCMVLYSSCDNKPGGCLTESSTKKCGTLNSLRKQYKAVYNKCVLTRALKNLHIDKKSINLVHRQLAQAPLQKCQIRRLQKMLHVDDSPATTSEAQQPTSRQKFLTPSLHLGRTQELTLMDFYSNWTQFNKQVLKFVEGQRALLALCTRNLPLDKMNGTLELDLIHQNLTDDVLNRAKRTAAELEKLTIKILSERLALQTEELRQLHSQIEKLQQKATDLSVSVDVAGHSQLADRLEVQAACLNEKDRRIVELLDRLSSLQERPRGDLFCEGANESVVEVDCHQLTAAEVAQLKPRDLIGHIRRELGVDARNLTAAQRRIFCSMRGKLGSALEKLAHDIYANDSQVVLEIIQNADDNFYNVGVQPHLSISVCPEKYMWVTNNEVGFTNENVLALSDVGNSTKKDISRFTGHKGIGFKSVFKVTRSPYIISKDFCFRFNLDSENIEENVGYILPEWVEKDDLEILIRPQKIDPGMTHFFFPFSPSTRFPAEELYEGMDFIPLFLRQLRTIELTIGAKKKVVAVSKNPHKEPSSLLETLKLTVVEHTTSADSGEVIQQTLREVVYRVYCKTLDVPKDLQVSQVGRAPPAKTELILAFPVLEDSQPDLQSVELQRVYSYLPVETAGFRFLIQADFHLVSSRDRVHSQDFFNRWLSWMIPVAFQEAFGLVDDPTMRNSPLRDELFTFLPTKEELARAGQSESSTDGFWRRVMKGIRDRVMDAPCILTETGKWARPNEVCVRPQGFEDLFTNDELRTVLGKEFVCKRMVTAAVHGLGCQYLCPAEVLTILNRPEFNASNKKHDWFFGLYRFLGSQLRSVGDFLERVFEAKIFPLESGVVSSLQEGRVFLWKSTPVYRIGAQVLRLLALDLTGLARNDQVYDFLETVGICEASALDVAESISEFHLSLARPTSSSSASTDTITKDQLWEQLRFLKENWSGVSEIVQTSKIGLLVPVQQSKVSGDVVVTPEGNSCSYHYAKCVYMPSLRNVFEAIDPSLNDAAMFLDDSWLQDLALQEDKEWKQFLTSTLGVNQSLRLCETYNDLFHPSEELNSALEVAIQDAKQGSPAKWRLLLQHLHTNWKYLKQSNSLIQSVKQAPSGYVGYRICDVFPALQQYKDLLLDDNGKPCVNLPMLDGVTDKVMMADLGIATEVNKNGVQKLEKLLRCPGSLGKEPVHDLAVWTKIYGMMLKYDASPSMLFVPGSSDFVPCRNVCLELPSVFRDWTDLEEFPASDYAGVPGIKDWFQPVAMHHLTKVLWAVYNKKNGGVQDNLEVVMECYRRMEELLATNSKIQKTPLVLTSAGFLLMTKKARHLVMPDQLDLYRKFRLNRSGFCPVRFIHPEVVSLKRITEMFVDSLEVPLLSKIINICPVDTTWNGYYAFPPGSTTFQLPTFLSPSLTNLYRALLAEFLFQCSSILEETDKVALGNLMRATTVYVCGLTCPKVPVAYTVHGISVSILEDYFIHSTADGQKQVIVSPCTLLRPLEEQVDFSALRDLFPGLVVDDNLKSAIRQMVDGDSKPRLDSQHVLTCSEEEKTFAFQITIEDTEAVRMAQGNRRSFGSSLLPHQRKYNVQGFSPRRGDQREIPGLTSHRPPPTSYDFSSQSMHNGVSRLQPPMKRELSPVSHGDSFTGRSFGPSSMLPKDEAREGPYKRPKLEHSWNFGASTQGVIDGVTGPSLQAKPEPVCNVRNPDQNNSSLFQQNVKSSFPEPASAGFLSSQALRPGIIGGAMVAPQAEGQRFVSTRAVCPGVIPGAMVTPQGFGPSALMAQQCVGVSATLEPQAEGQGNRATNVSDMADKSDVLQRMKKEILSWSKRPVSEIETRLRGVGKLRYNFFVHTGSASSSALWQGLRHLEGDDEFRKWIGLWAEKVVFGHLLDLCRSGKPLLEGAKYVSHPPEAFSSENWVSTARQHFENRPCPCDDTKGYDFVYRQSNGVTVYVEVKGHTTYANSFLLSANEWEVARRVHNSETEVYVIMGVNLNPLSAEGAQITYLLENPVEMAERGAVVQRPFSYLMEVVSPVAPPAVTRQEPAYTTFSDASNSSAFPGPFSKWTFTNHRNQKKRPILGRNRWMSSPKRGRVDYQYNNKYWP